MANRWSLTTGGGGGSASKECGDEFEITVLLDKSASTSSSSPVRVVIVNDGRAGGNGTDDCDVDESDDDGGDDDGLRQRRLNNDQTSGVDDDRDGDDEERIIILDERPQRCKRNGNGKVKMSKPKNSSANASPTPVPQDEHTASLNLDTTPASRLSGTSSSNNNRTNPSTPTSISNNSKRMANAANSSSNNNNQNSKTGPSGKHKNPDEECDVIGDLIGDYGKWQFVMTFLLSLFQVPNTFHIYSPTFQAAEKSHWCRRPSHLNYTSVELWRNVTQAQENCRILNYDWSSVGSEQLLNNLSLPVNLSHVACNSWEFNLNDNLGNTWVSDWNLVCDKEYLKDVAEMFFLVGVATGGITSGVLSDKFGRKKMLFISAVLQSIFGLALYFVDSLEFLFALRALLGLVSVSVTYAGLILAIEYVDGKWRTIAGMYNLFPLPVSYIIISGIAYLTQDHRKLQLCIGLPGVLLCFLWFVLPESPRWLLCKGRVAEVKEIVRKAAAYNNRPLPDNLDKLLKPPTDVDDSMAGACDLFRTRYLRRVTFCFLCIWFTMNLVYYGLVLNMNSFGGNIYLNSALAGLVEIPAIALAMYIINRTGKKWLFCATFFACSIACLCAAVVEGNLQYLSLKITFVMIGKFTISAGNTIMPVYTAELYPTAIRNVGVGACNVAAGFALVLTPYLSMLPKIEDHLLMTLLIAWCIFGAIVVVFLPETMQHHDHEERNDDKEADTQMMT
ncbi:solute carrier family 22 member 21 isoform X1 [Topomyia yanbarensis]|uniref:solute carrier family 22 member 21 isoform X1 n=2 Tax=Topomyia yanbarensis TaxID=2498891 RepID=UPI00273CEBFD|nr:solute carrier family 22 member 21 isoform X1 [Topomyia yanbarensis]XP_058823478.1 solute carrier family 22 member 21 isoform X1 [Topomyia yanbarensis]XP_058823479.1 solute carrier family 22 member 21 isoform X1 [Topomyia yanbarensis]XP_058823480.1 solute carrier family 22 member 21 isoform X1 [Topomyia yanbarensis]